MSATQLKNRKRVHIADGVFKAELHAFFSRAIINSGYSGFEMTNLGQKPEIILKVTSTKELLGGGLDKDGNEEKKNPRRVHELESMVQKRFGYSNDGIQIKVHRLPRKGLCASALAESIKIKLLDQTPVRIAASSAIRMAVDKDKAKGCEVIISGKLSQQRAKSMKFKKGYMISSGQVRDHYLDVAYRHVQLKQGMMGVKVKIMKSYNTELPQCARIPLPDNVIFDEVKKEDHDQKQILNPAVGNPN